MSNPIVFMMVSTHSRPKAAGAKAVVPAIPHKVSTHSRPKAAGAQSQRLTFRNSGFNTQPPEGGWPVLLEVQVFKTVSTHSRPKAAGRAISTADIS